MTEIQQDEEGFFHLEIYRNYKKICLFLNIQNSNYSQFQGWKIFHSMMHDDDCILHLIDRIQ